MRGNDMDRCCMQSFVRKGFREGFKLANFGDRYTCETCGQVFVLQRVEERERSAESMSAIGPNEFEVVSPDAVIHYTWEPLKH
jgi:hypothetical protein